MNHNKIENLLSPYKEVIGSAYIPYKNHVHRIVNFTLELKDERKADDESKIAIAAVFHDIGMWTAHSFDYLEPSIAEATHYLRAQEKTEWIEEITLIIDMHHKLSVYTGKFADNVEAFRKADLIDLTKGLKRFGLSKDLLAENYMEFPMGSFRKIIVSNFFQNLWKHPSRPLPMFKK
jgi:uncharacterized membrane protein